MNFENITRHEKKPVTKDPILYYSIYMKRPEEANPYRQKVDLVVAQGCVCAATANGYGVSCWGSENVLKFIMVMVAQLCEYT